jgi:Holliday junction resolvase RusA-like endonuclease
MMRFTVFGKPEGKARARVPRRGHAYTPDKTRAYEEMVQLAFREQCWGEVPFTAGIPVKVSIIAFYAVPQSASRKMRERMKNNEIAPTVKPDWDNVGKIVCDALNGVAWHDDAQVVDAHVEKRYGIEPMVCVVIEPIKEGETHEAFL